MTDANQAPASDAESHSRRPRRSTSSLNWLALALSVFSLIVAGIAAAGTWAQVQVAQDSTSEKLVLIGMTAGILDLDVENGMGEPSARTMTSIQKNEILSVWMDVANNGRAAGSLTEVTYITIGRQPIPVYSVKCSSLDDDIARDCMLPLALGQGQQVRIRVDLHTKQRELLNCPDRIDLLLFTLTDSAGRDLNVGAKNEEPSWDCFN